MQIEPAPIPFLRPGTLAAALIGVALLLSAPVLGASNRKPHASPEIAGKEADLQELRGRIDSLRKDLAESETHKSEASDRLRESEKQISNLQRELHNLSEQRSGLQQTLTELTRQSAQLSGTLAQQQAQLEKLVHRQYLQGTPDSLQLLLNGNDPNQMARDLYYLSAIARARADMLGEIKGNLEKKKALAADTQERSDELAEVEAQQKQRHAQLSQQREERKALLAQISDRISSQRKEIGNLQQNEKRLSQLIDRLAKVIAAQAAQAAAKARARPAPPPVEPEPPKTAGKQVEPSRPKAVEVVENRFDPESSSSQFAKLKGSLRLPTRGALAGRFGSPREGGGSWKGLFIRAGNGTEVRAVANGRVVFADWMRGFGNLLIIDHGDAYLSIYGNNDSLLKQVGEVVKGGEKVATVGNSGGNPESGLYFELRHQGQPIDPMKWASLK
ncbi:MAG TPA: peptidoglycan DD-metalloendopeptidase family protein [Rhodocyclaceae bacterium]|nr:peptidoglycan DD-metalloendopeptidase family protein [Rhodocyclaceae bacterium]